MTWGGVASSPYFLYLILFIFSGVTPTFARLYGQAEPFHDGSVTPPLSAPRESPKIEQCVRIYQFYHNKSHSMFVERQRYYKGVRLAGDLLDSDHVDAPKWFTPLKNPYEQRELCETGGVLATYRYLLSQPSVCRYIGFASWKDRWKVKPVLTERGNYMSKLNAGLVDLAYRGKDTEREGGEGAESIITGFYPLVFDQLKQAAGYHRGYIKAWEDAMRELARPVFGDDTPLPGLPSGARHWGYYSQYIIMEWDKLRYYVLLLEAHTSVFHRVFQANLKHLAPENIHKNASDLPASGCPFTCGRYSTDLCYCFMGERLVNAYVWLAGIESASWINQNGTLESLWLWNSTLQEREAERNAGRKNTQKWTPDVIERLYLAQWEQHRMYPFGAYEGYYPLITELSHKASAVSSSPSQLPKPVSNARLIAYPDDPQCECASPLPFIVLTATTTLSIVLFVQYMQRRHRNNRSRKHF